MNHGMFPKKFSFAFQMAASLALALALAGCGNKGASEENAESAAAAHTGGKPVDSATAGTITGTIRFEGTPPPMRNINMIDVPNCAKMHSTPIQTEGVVPGDNGTLQNVVVYLQGDLRGYSFPQAAEPVKVAQRGCVYSPHVVAMMTGDSLQVSNEDQVTHNINAMSQFRQGWNETQPPGSAPVMRQPMHEEIPMTVKCNMHPWMRFYLVVLSHPYFQVTGKDGQFSLRNVPPGNYTLTAWHETYGTKKQAITVQPKQEQSVSITFTDKDRP
jgi:plastocyanin/predicted small lipoprotein YifL